MAQLNEGVNGKLVSLLVEILEGILAASIALLVLINGVKLLINVLMGSVSSMEVSKELILRILDMALLLILSVDVLRTLITAIRARYLPIRIVVEAAMIAVLREIISIEVRHLDYKMVFTLTVAIIGLGLVWLLIFNVERRHMAAESPHSGSPGQG